MISILKKLNYFKDEIFVYVFKCKNSDNIEKVMLIVCVLLFVIFLSAYLST